MPKKYKQRSLIEAWWLSKRQLLNYRIFPFQTSLPARTILAGPPEPVKACRRSLIHVPGKYTGYVMATGTGMDEVKQIPLHAMTEFTKEYGIYK